MISLGKALGWSLVLSLAGAASGQAINPVFYTKGWHQAEITGLHVSPSGKTLYTTGRDGTARFWKSTDWNLLKTVSGGTEVNASSMNPDGSRIALALTNGQIAVLSTATGNVLKSWQAHGGAVNDIDYSPDGLRLVSGGVDKGVNVWDASTGTFLYNLAGHTGSVTTVEFSGTGDKIASGGLDWRLKVWNLATKAIIFQLGGVVGYLKSAFSNDGTLIATMTGDRAIKLWSATNGSLVKSLTTTWMRVSDVGFSPDSHTVVAATDRGVLTWDTGTFQSGTTYNMAASEPGLATLPSDGTIVYASGLDKSLIRWQVGNSVEASTSGTHSGAAARATFSPLGRLFATITSSVADTFTNIWKYPSCELVKAVKTGQGAFLEGFSFNDGFLAVSHHGGTDFYETATWTKVQTISGIPAFCPTRNEVVATPSLTIYILDDFSIVKTLAEFGQTPGRYVYSADGKAIVCAYLNGLVNVWDVASGQVRAHWNLPSAEVTSISCNADASKVSTAHVGGGVYVWDSATGSVYRDFSMQTEYIEAVFEPSHKSLVTTSRDGMIRLWNIEKGVVTSVLSDGLTVPYYTSVSPDGRKILCSRSDKTFTMLFNLQRSGGY